MPLPSQRGETTKHPEVTMGILLCILVCLATPIAWADTADEIIANARKAQRVENSIQHLEMVLISRNGAKRERKFEMRVRRDDKIVRTYVRFSHPSDVAGTQLVVIDNPAEATEQLLYLPALKRTNRIAGKARKGSFMGSDFSYEDLEISDDAGATHTLVSETDTIWVIDTKPGANSSYGRIRAHVSKADYLPRRVEFFDAKDQPKKLLEVLQTETDNGTIIPIHSVMKNLRRNTATEMRVTEWRLNVPDEEIPDETFTIGFLERNG
jgi:outer membrane lipoprotein-sorting protein